MRQILCVRGSASGISILVLRTVSWFCSNSGGERLMAVGFMCHCGNTINTAFAHLSTGCTVQCAGNTDGVEYCGGDQAISIFHLDPAS